MPPVRNGKMVENANVLPGKPLNKISSTFRFPKTVLKVLTSFRFEKRRIDGTLIQRRPLLLFTFMKKLLRREPSVLTSVGGLLCNTAKIGLRKFSDLNSRSPVFHASRCKTCSLDSRNAMP
jgi:hypothetical protein